MKVLIISAHPLYDNRIARHISTCVKNGIDVEYCNISVSNSALFSFHDDKHVKLICIRQAISKKNIIGLLKACLTIRKVLRSSNADIVHIHDPYLLPFARIAVKNGKRVFFDKHESYEKLPDLNARFGTWCEKHYKGFIEREICVNEMQTEYIYKLRGDEALVVPNYQQMDLFDNAMQQKHLDGMIRSTFIASNVSPSSSYNGELLFDVIERTLEQCENFEFVMGGNSPAYTERKQGLARRFPNRFFDVGVVSYDEVVRRTCASDIGLLLCRETANSVRNSPNKLSEYILSGQAILAVGVFADAAKIDNCGAVITYPFDVSADVLSSCLIGIIQNQSHLEQMQQNAWDMRKTISWESVENRYIELYKDIGQRRICK